MRIKIDNRKNRLLAFLLTLFMIVVMAAACGKDDSGDDDDREDRKPTVTAEPTAEPTEKAEPTPTPKEDYSKVELPEDEIIFIDGYTNGAWGYSNDGFFIDTNGDVWSYDFSQPGYYYNYYLDEEKSVVEHLEEADLFEIIRKYTEPVGKVDIDKLKKAYALGLKVDPDAEFKYESMACDMGQYSLYFLNPETDEKVMIYSRGDTDANPKDKYAKKLKKFYDNEIDLNIRDSKIRYLYSADSIHFLNRHVGTVPRLTGKFVAKDPEALKKLAAESGLNVDEILDEMSEYEWDYCIYFVEILSYSTGGHVNYSSAIMYYDGMVDFIPSNQNRSPDESEMVTEAFETYYHVAAVPLKYYTEGEEFTDFKGNEWTVYETAVATPDDALPVIE